MFSPVTQLRRVLLAVLLAAVFVWLLTAWAGITSSSLGRAVVSRARARQPGPEGNTAFWNQTLPLLLAHRPPCPSPQRLGNVPGIGHQPSATGPRPNLLDMPDRDVLDMKTAHADFLRAVANAPPAVPYVPGTRGIVATAGGPYLPVFVISLRMLRRTGSLLPVEVFLASRDEYEPEICDGVLVSLNAKCVVLSDILDTARERVAIEKYQLKAFAMIFSSFEEMLFLDADSFPVARPDVLFKSEQFRSNNLVTWPDFWSSSASPFYYTIASQPAPPLSLRASTESGQVLISKKTHSQTLLLCLYYNFWGPSHYYRLLSQGGPGEGDKETFLAAAMAVGERFYQVAEPVRALGHPVEGGFAGSAMAQFNPIDDFNQTRSGGSRDKADQSKGAAPRPFFLHVNVPKFNPSTLFFNGTISPDLKNNGVPIRVWTAPEDVMQAIGFDVERQFAAEVLWTACSLETSFKAWKGQTGICDGAQDYWNAVFSADDPKL